jgi:membrane-associated protein
VDRHIGEFVQSHGTWVYALLFAIVFVETGVVLMPFLPGDSLLFITGAMCGAGLMDLPLAMGVLLVAAILGDQCNYLIGRRVGVRVFSWNNRWFNRRAFDQAHAFYQRYGAITLVLARLMPFVRTFAPFVAGVADMERTRFTLFNVVGALIWVVGLCGAGFLFGNLEVVRKNLQIIIWALILVPGLVAIVGAYKASRTAP